MTRIITVLFVTTFFSSTAYAEESKKVFCQSDAELEFFGWDVGNAKTQEMADGRTIRFMVMNGPGEKALRQTTSAPFSPTQTICVQQEIVKE